jgi:hypothetical protein
VPGRHARGGLQAPEQRSPVSTQQTRIGYDRRARGSVMTLARDAVTVGLCRRPGARTLVDHPRP